jgi:hypothetical protein
MEYRGETLFLLLYQKMFGSMVLAMLYTSGERLPWNTIESRETLSKW